MLLWGNRSTTLEWNHRFNKHLKVLHSIHLLYYVAQSITSGSVKGLLMLQEKLYIGGLLPKNIATKNQFGISPTVIFFHFSKMVRNCKSVSERLPAKTGLAP
jgi:hypothetical protein